MRRLWLNKGKCQVTTGISRHLNIHMNLPHMDPKKIAIAIMAKQKPDMADEPAAAPDHDEDVMTAAHELIEAVHAKDPHAVADALKAAFYACDAEPHEEGPHMDEEMT